ncbi:hypothetical protein niasHT_023848 [Heterodera trifolii]|uniref:CCHC-type domain-containing protein n=1 Tax=Heterodera trifolii TaxID=157864 RepID=A0ABD2JCD4_9BILA
MHSFLSSNSPLNVELGDNRGISEILDEREIRCRLLAVSANNNNLISHTEEENRRREVERPLQSNNFQQDFGLRNSNTTAFDQMYPPVHESAPPLNFHRNEGQMQYTQPRVDNNPDPIFVRQIAVHSQLTARHITANPQHHLTMLENETSQGQIRENQKNARVLAQIIKSLDNFSYSMTLNSLPELEGNSGSDKVRAFFRRFDVATEEWPEAKRINALRSKCSGRAERALNVAVEKNPFQYEFIKRALIHQLESTDARHMSAFDELMNGVFRRNNEAIDDLADRISSLVRKAYPALPEHLYDDYSIRHFIRALQNPELALALEMARQTPMVFDEFVALAARAEATQKASCRAVQRQNNMPVFQSQYTQSHNNDRQMQPPFRHTSFAQKNFTNSDQVCCYNYNQFGHFMRQCPHLQRSRVETGTQNSNSSVPQKQSPFFNFVRQNSLGEQQERAPQNLFVGGVLISPAEMENFSEKDGNEKLVQLAEAMNFESKDTAIFPNLSTKSEVKIKRASEFSEKEKISETRRRYWINSDRKRKKVEKTSSKTASQMKNRILRNSGEKGHKKFGPKEQVGKKFEVQNGGGGKFGKSGRIFSNGKNPNVQLGTIEILEGGEELKRKRVNLDSKDQREKVRLNVSSGGSQSNFGTIRADADHCMIRRKVPFNRGWVELTASCPGPTSHSASDRPLLRGLRCNGSVLNPRRHHLSTAGCEMCS